VVLIDRSHTRERITWFRMHFVFECALAQSQFYITNGALAHTVYISSIHHLIHSSPWPVFSPSYRCPIAIPLNKTEFVFLSPFLPPSLHLVIIQNCVFNFSSPPHPPHIHSAEARTSTYIHVTQLNSPHYISAEARTFVFHVAISGSVFHYMQTCTYTSSCR